MKFCCYLTLLFLLPRAVMAQGESYTPTAQVVELATWLPTSAAITGQKYVMPGRISTYHYDEKRNELILITTREKELNLGAVGELLVFDLKTATVKWSAKLNTFRVHITPGHILTSENGNTRCYARTNGKQLWKKTDAKLKYIDAEKGIVLTDYIRALDINTGKSIWQRYLPSKQNWEDVAVLDDSSVLVATGNIYKINLYTGKGWSTGNITSRSEFSAPSALGMVPEAVSFPATEPMSFQERSPYWNSTTSDILIDSNTVYFATAKRLLSLSAADGSLNWAAPLPLPGSIASLYISGEQIIYTAQGKIADRAGNHKKFSTAYIASFNKNTGNSINTDNLGNEPLITTTLTDEGAILLLAEKNLYEWSNGKTVSFPLGEDTTRYLNVLPASEICPDLAANYTEPGYFIVSSRGKLSFVHATEQPLTHFADADAAVCRTYGDYTLSYNGSNTISKGSTEIVRTPPAGRGFIAKGKLYIPGADFLSVVPLEEPK